MRLIDADAFLKSEISRCHCIPLVGSCERDEERLDFLLMQAPTVDLDEIRKETARGIMEKLDQFSIYADVIDTIIKEIGFEFGIDEIESKSIELTDGEMYVKFRTEIDSMYAPKIMELCEVVRIEDEENKTIGMMCINDKYIDCLYILPNHRRKGYGKRAVIKYIKEKGMLNDLHILNTNIPALNFWNSIFDLKAESINDIDTYYKIAGMKAGVLDEKA